MEVVVLSITNGNEDCNDVHKGYWYKGQLGFLGLIELDVAEKTVRAADAFFPK